jgi:ElaB/YqjD/DUF883 family membrane-anchored ribosome-binding protein
VPENQWEEQTQEAYGQRKSDGAIRVTRRTDDYRAYPYPGVGLAAVASLLAGAVRYGALKAGLWRPAAVTRSG